jgi:glutathione-specific gamma-glutamylcyclotransferase
MPRIKEQMTLTRELVASTIRQIEDSGPIPGWVLMSDEDYDSAVRDLLSQAPASPIWLFAYGSLLWKPAIEVGESRCAVVRGWHRAFCFRVPRFRGTPDHPGLMMALDRGGQCRGMIFQISDPVEHNLNRLIRREMTVKPMVNVPRWLNAQTTHGSVQAIGFVVNRQDPRYVGKLALDKVADVLSTAGGHWGSCAEYLYETVAQLEKLGIHDRNLWRLQQLVAERILRGSSAHQ